MVAGFSVTTAQHKMYTTTTAKLKPNLLTLQNAKRTQHKSHGAESLTRSQSFI
jgi:hypothetical protein